MVSLKRDITISTPFVEEISGLWYILPPSLKKAFGLIPRYVAVRKLNSAKADDKCFRSKDTLQFFPRL
jgi:hypothetical protein